MRLSQRPARELHRKLGQSAVFGRKLVFLYMLQLPSIAMLSPAAAMRIILFDFISVMMVSRLVRVLLDFGFDAFVVGVFPGHRGEFLLNLLADHIERRHDENLEDHTDKHAAD